MRTVEELIEEVKHLPQQERLRLIEAIGDFDQNGDQRAEPDQSVALGAFLSLAGTAETDYTDVSSDKYKHLVQIYEDNHKDT